MYETTKTQKCDSAGNIESIKLKVCLIITQTRTYTYKAAKEISQYLKPFKTSSMNIQSKKHSPLLNWLKNHHHAKKMGKMYLMMLSPILQTSQIRIQSIIY